MAGTENAQGQATAQNHSKVVLIRPSRLAIRLEQADSGFETPAFPRHIGAPAGPTNRDNRRSFREWAECFASTPEAPIFRRDQE